MLCERQLVRGVIRNGLIGVHHIGSRYLVDNFVLAVLYAYPSVRLQNRGKTVKVQQETILVCVLLGLDHNALFNVEPVILVYQVHTREHIFIGDLGGYFIRLHLFLHGFHRFSWFVPRAGARFFTRHIAFAPGRFRRLSLIRVFYFRWHTCHRGTTTGLLGRVGSGQRGRFRLTLYHGTFRFAFRGQGAGFALPYIAGSRSIGDAAFLRAIPRASGFLWDDIRNFPALQLRRFTILGKLAGINLAKFRFHGTCSQRF